MGDAFDNFDQFILVASMTPVLNCLQAPWFRWSEFFAGVNNPGNETIATISAWIHLKGIVSRDDYLFEGL